MNPSEIMSAVYTLIQVETPTADPAAGAVANGTEISLSCATADAVIHFTTDGSDPDDSDPTYNPAAKPTITAPTTIKAIAYKANNVPSDVLTAAYTLS